MLHTQNMFSVRIMKYFSKKKEIILSIYIYIYDHFAYKFIKREIKWASILFFYSLYILYISVIYIQCADIVVWKISQCININVIWDMLWCCKFCANTCYMFQQLINCICIMLY